MTFRVLDLCCCEGVGAHTLHGLSQGIPPAYTAWFARMALAQGIGS